VSWRAVEFELHPIGIILNSNKIDEIRFSVSKQHWRVGRRHKDYAVYQALPERVVGQCVKWMGAKVDGKVHVSWETDGKNSDEYLAVLLRPSLGMTGTKKDDWHRKTTTGEVIQSWGYYVALALNPSVPVDNAWQDDMKPGDLFPPMAMGRHGMHKNRFRRMRELQAMMFSKDESELDPRAIRGATAAPPSQRSTSTGASW
jgi:hypothetical protein